MLTDKQEDWTFELSGLLGKIMTQADAYLDKKCMFPDQIQWFLEDYGDELANKLVDEWQPDSLFGSDADRDIPTVLYHKVVGMRTSIDYVTFHLLYTNSLGELSSLRKNTEANLSLLTDLSKQIYTEEGRQKMEQHIKEVQEMYSMLQTEIVIPLLNLEGTIARGDQLFDYDFEALPTKYVPALETIKGSLDKTRQQLLELVSTTQNLPTESDLASSDFDVVFITTYSNAQADINQLKYLALSITNQTEFLKVKIQNLIAGALNLFDFMAIVVDGDYEEIAYRLKQSGEEFKVLESITKKEQIKLEGKQEEGEHDYTREIDLISSLVSSLSRIQNSLEASLFTYQSDIQALKANLITASKEIKY